MSLGMINRNPWVNTAGTPFPALPEGIAPQIFSHLTPEELMQLATVNRVWADFAAVARSEIPTLAPSRGITANIFGRVF